MSRSVRRATPSADPLRLRARCVRVGRYEAAARRDWRRRRWARCVRVGQGHRCMCRLQQGRDARERDVEARPAVLAQQVHGGCGLRRRRRRAQQAQRRMLSESCHEEPAHSVELARRARLLLRRRGLVFGCVGGSHNTVGACARGDAASTCLRQVGLARRRRCSRSAAARWSAAPSALGLARFLTAGARRVPRAQRTHQERHAYQCHDARQRSVQQERASAASGARRRRMMRMRRLMRTRRAYDPRRPTSS